MKPKIAIIILIALAVFSVGVMFFLFNATNSKNKMFLPQEPESSMPVIELKEDIIEKERLMLLEKLKKEKENNPVSVEEKKVIEEERLKLLQDLKKEKENNPVSIEDKKIIEEERLKLLEELKKEKAQNE